MLFPSIHPPYISWFYLNQSNFFWGLFSQLNVSSKQKGQNKDQATASSCLMLATALLLPAGGFNPVMLYSNKIICFQVVKWSARKLAG